MKNNKRFNKQNYYRSTYAVFKEVNQKDLPFSAWTYISKSNSSYYYTTEGVYRLSNHWGRAAKCRWVLESNNDIYISKGRIRIGYALWSDFYENDESTKCYYIKVDYTQNSVTYDHKSRDISQKSIYRTAKETQKIIKKIKQILITDKWFKYYDDPDIEKVRKQLIENLLISKTI